MEQQPTTNDTNPCFDEQKVRIYTSEDLLDLNFLVDEKDLVIGTPQNAIIRPKTKNLIEAPEKSFKTTFMLRLSAGLACGETVFPVLPILRQRRVLYLHGEMSMPEIQERVAEAVQGLPKEGLKNLLQGKVIGGHLIWESGQRLIEDAVKAYRPDDLVLDPWQSYIGGCGENEFKDMSKAQDFCNHLIETYDVTLHIPIHQGKDSTRGARGHSSIGGWRDTRIEIQRPNNGDTALVSVEPRWGKRLDRFKLRFEAGTMWPDDTVNLKGQTAKIAHFLTQNGGEAQKDEVAAYLGGTPDAVRHAIKRAEEAKAIVIRGGSLSLAEGPKLVQ